MPVHTHSQGVWGPQNHKAPGLPGAAEPSSPPRPSLDDKYFVVERCFFRFLQEYLPLGGVATRVCTQGAWAQGAWAHGAMAPKVASIGAPGPPGPQSPQGPWAQGPLGLCPPGPIPGVRGLATWGPGLQIPRDHLPWAPRWQCAPMQFTFETKTTGLSYLSLAARALPVESYVLPLHLTGRPRNHSAQLLSTLQQKFPNPDPAQPFPARGNHFGWDFVFHVGALLAKIF